MWSTHWARGYVPSCYKQVVVPNYYYKLKVQPRIYNITTRDDVTYRKMQTHMKPYQLQCNKTEDEHSDNNMQTLKANCSSLTVLKVKTISF